jgi:hypothetical protein
VGVPVHILHDLLNLWGKATHVFPLCYIFISMFSAKFGVIVIGSEVFSIYSSVCRMCIAFEEHTE